MQFLSSTTFYDIYEDNEVLIHLIRTPADLVNQATRLVYLWNALNSVISYMSYKALVFSKDNFLEEVAGWCHPLIRGAQASDPLISKTLIKIFNATGRIVINAASPNTFVTTESGDVLCIDVTMALQFRHGEESVFAHARQRRKSEASFGIWESVKDKYSALWAESLSAFPETIAMIKALLFISLYRPNIFDVSFLKNALELTNILAHSYDRLEDESGFRNALSVLDKIAVPGRILIGSGNYNYVYLYPEGTRVLKTLKDPRGYASDNPARSIRIWDELNGSLLGSAKTVDHYEERAWESPFVEGRQASDTEMSELIIDIFNSTGRIVFDGPFKKNILTRADGKVFCIDVGMALDLEKRDAVTLSDGRIRRKSVESLSIWEETKAEYHILWDQAEITYPKTVQTIRALLFIKNNRPDIPIVDFLDEEGLLDKLAKASLLQEGTVGHTKALASLDEASAPVSWCTIS